MGIRPSPLEKNCQSHSGAKGLTDKQTQGLTDKRKKKLQVSLPSVRNCSRTLS